MRPKPRKAFAAMVFWPCSGCAYLPCASACQISRTPSLIGFPSPSDIRPRTVTRSPGTPAGAMASITSGRNPILRYGPTVCEGVVSKLMASAPAGFHRRVFAPTEPDVEPIGERDIRQGPLPVELRDQALARLLVRDTVVHRVIRQQWIAWEIHLRHQPLHQAEAKERKMQVRGPPGVVVIAPRVRRGLDGDEAVGAVRAGQHAADAGEVGVEWRVVVVDVVTVAAGRVRLPELDQRIRDRLAVFVPPAAGGGEGVARRRAFW